MCQSDRQEIDRIAGDAHRMVFERLSEIVGDTEAGVAAVRARMAIVGSFAPITPLDVHAAMMRAFDPTA